MSDLLSSLAHLSPAQRSLLMERLQGIGTPNRQVKGEIFPIAREGNAFLLSFAQERLWFLNQLAPDDTSYIVPLAFRITGPFNPKALEQGLNEVIRRHEILRTTFTTINDQPLQIIAPQLTLKLPIVDLRVVADPERSAQIQEKLVQVIQQPFDLTRGPLMRGVFLWQGEQEWFFALAIHHIVCDGWSGALLFGELATLYKAFSRGEASPLSDLPVQYVDFAAWQRQRLQAESTKDALAYWKQQLADSLPLLDLPTSPARLSSSLQSASRMHKVLPVSLTAKLKALSQQEGVTLFMLLQACFYALLYRYTGQADIVIGTPAAHRPHKQLEPLIGLFLNMLVLRVDLSNNPGFRELLIRVRKKCLEAYAHQELPFEQLVEALKPARYLDRTPFFQVVFSFDHTIHSSLALPNLEVVPVEIHNGMEKFDLTWAIEETAEGLEVVVGYDTALFEVSLMQRMLRHFQQILAAVIRSPDIRLSELSLLTEEEYAQQLIAWNDTRIQVPEPCLPELVEAQAERTPDIVALVSEKLVLTYAELNVRANQLAYRLQKCGVGPEALVGVYMERSVEQVLSILAILKVGGAYVPLDPAHPQGRIAYIADNAHLKLILADEHLCDRLPVHIHHICPRLEASAISLQSTNNPTHSIAADNIAYVIYTSGSTGTPKGVMISHQGLFNYLNWAGQYYNVAAGNGSVVHSSLAFDLTITSLFPALLHGKPVVLVPEERAVEHLAETIRQGQYFSLLKITPAHLDMLNQLLLPEELAASTNALVIGGEALRAQSVELWRQYAPATRLINEYGPTETVVGCCIYEVAAEDASSGEIPIGRPINNTTLYVLDKHLRPVSVGVAGELYIGGLGVARGYVDRPELTAERFIPDLYGRTPGSRCYKTGDLARYRDDGVLEFLGRIDDQIKLRGYRIALGEVEATLKQHPSVRDAVVVVREDSAAEKQLVAYIVLQEKKPHPEELHSFLQKSLPVYMVPGIFMVLEQLPLTPNGKVNRQLLPEPLVEHSIASATYTAAQTELEAQLVLIWEVVLGVERVGIDDNFFLLGGHSLKAVQIVSRIHEILNVRLALRDIFACPTVRMLARQIERVEQEAFQEIPRLLQGQSYELSPAQLRFWLIHQLEADSSAYTVLHSVSLQGEIVYEALEKALLRMLARHESLRTAFYLEQNRPVQVIEPVPDQIMMVVDLRALSPEACHQALENLRYKALEFRFNLHIAPLLRAVFCRMGEEEGELQLILHHIICDGWSLEVLQRELLICYQSYLRGQEPSFPPLPIQYKDYAAWQNTQLSSPIMQEHERFWRQYLHPPLPEFVLPSDYVQEIPEKRQGSGYRFIMTSEEYEQIKALTARQHVSLFMICVAALTIWLARLTDQTDVLVATPVAGREHGATRTLVGLLLNTVLLRNQVFEHDTFATLLQRVRASTLEAMEHQAYPFEKLLEQVAVTRQVGRFPLTPVLINMLNFPGEQVPEISLEGIGLHELNVAVKNDFNFHIKEYSNGLDVSCHYRQGLFKPETIVYLLEAYRQTLIDVARNQHVRLQDLRLFRAELLATRRSQSGPAAEYERLLAAGTVVEQFRRQVQAHPDTWAVITLRDRCTYAQLEVRAQRIAHGIRRQMGEQHTPGRVALLFYSSVEMVAALLGVLQAGAAFIPLDPDYPLPRLAATLYNSCPALLLTHTHAEPIALQLVEQHSLPCLNIDQLEDHMVGLKDIKGTPDDLAYLLYTSGSTGTPKGIMQTHRNVLHFVASYSQVLQLQPADRLTLLSSYVFDGAIMDIFGALLNGCTLYPLKLLEQASFLDILEWLQEQQITIWHSIPSVYRELLRACKPRLSQAQLALRWVVLGGEEVRDSDVQGHLQSTMHIPLVNLYGQTESSFTTYAIYDDRWHNERIALGEPVINTQVSVVAETGGLARVYEVGELIITSPYVSPGYWHRDRSTALNHNQPGSIRHHHSGDLVRLMPDGRLLFSGRKDFQVKIRGYRVEVAEIEAALRESNLVQEAVVQKQLIAGEEQLVAYVVPTFSTLKRVEDCSALSPPPARNNIHSISENVKWTCAGEQGELSSTMLRTMLAKKLPRYMLPALFVQLQVMPKTPGGKLDRTALPVPQQAIAENFVQPATPLEKSLVSIWCELLGLDQISINANFFELGGHSLLAVQLQTRIRENIGVDLPLRTLFEHPTIEALAVALVEAQLSELDEQDFERLLLELEQN